MRIAPFLVAGALLSAGTSHAFDVDSLPYPGSADWTVIVFSGTSMTTGAGGTEVTLATAANRGLWFGNGLIYGDNANWSIATAAEGNYLSLTAKFSADAADWSAYMTDQVYGASFHFAPTACANNCYGLPVQAGVAISHLSGSGQPASTFIALDLGAYHTYEWLLKEGRVTYRIDGQVVHSGPAAASPASNPLLVIGDGSGTTRTGVGSMTISQVAFDAAPPISAIPEPHTWALMLAGLGLVGWAGRKTRG